MTDQQVPQCVDIEQCVLGAMLIDKNVIHPVSRVVKSEMFYKPAHKEIFSAMIDLYNKDIILDLISLSDALRTSGKLEGVGGEYYLSELTTKVSSTVNSEYNAHIILEYAIKRQMIKAADKIINEAYQETSDVFELLASVQKLDTVVSGEMNDCKVPDKTTMLNEYVEYIQNKSIKKKFPTGFPTLDRMLKGGFPTGGYSIIGGVEGSGKTTAMLSWALHMAQNGFKVHFIEGEMPINEILDRLTGMWTGVSIDDIVRGDKYEELTAPFVKMIHEIPLTLVKNHARTIESLVADIKHSVYKGADVIFIDYLQVFAPREKSDNEFSAIKVVSETIRSLSLKNPIHICAASAYTRDGNFYGSKLLDHDGTQLIKLEYDQDNESETARELTDPVRTVTMRVKKNRGGARGALNITYYLDSQKMVELSNLPERIF